MTMSLCVSSISIISEKISSVKIVIWRLLGEQKLYFDAFRGGPLNLS